MVPTLLSEHVSQSDLRWTFLVPAETPFFRGHFPAHPILPGVLALAWLLTAAEKLQGPAPAALELVNVKFQVVIEPGASVELVLVIKSAGHFQGTIRSAAGVHATALIPRHNG